MYFLLCVLSTPLKAAKVLVIFEFERFELYFTYILYGPMKSNSSMKIAVAILVPTETNSDK